MKNTNTQSLFVYDENGLRVLHCDLLFLCTHVVCDDSSSSREPLVRFEGDEPAHRHGLGKAGCAGCRWDDDRFNMSEIHTVHTTSTQHQKAQCTTTQNTTKAQNTFVPVVRPIYLFRDSANKKQQSDLPLIRTTRAFQDTSATNSNRSYISVA